MKKFFERVISLTIVICLCLAMLLAVTMKAEASGNVTICGVDIGIKAGTHMQFTTASGANSESGYYYKGYNLYGSQCIGFARWCQYKLFGGHWYNTTGKFYNVSVNGVDDIARGTLTVDSLKAMISVCKPGAHLRTHPAVGATWGHSMVITEITDQGFSIVQCNGENNNEYNGWKQNYVGTWTYTWSSYVNSTYGKRGIDYIEMPINYNYPVGPHTCNQGAYVYYEAAHPHYNCYQCSVCGEVGRNIDETNYLENCRDCNYPGKPVLQNMKSEYLDTEKVTFNWEPTKNTTHYNIWLQVKNKQGEWEAVEHITYVSSGYQKSLSKGEYRCVLQSYNSKHWLPDGSDWLYTEGEYFYFSVNSLKDFYPDKPVLENMKTDYPHTEAVTFEWKETKNTTHYNIWLEYKNAQGAWKKLEQITYVTPGYKKNLPIGEYRCLVQSYNSEFRQEGGGDWLYTEGNYHYFTVSEAEYTINYDANGGTGAPANQTKTYGTDLTLSSKIPTRFGYTFKGWTMFLPATTVGFLPGGTYTKDMGLTLYAVWEPATEIPANVTNRLMNTTIPFAGGSTYFSFTPEVTAKYHFESFLDDDTLIYIYDANGSTLAKDNDSGDGKNFLLNYQFSAGVTYYVEIQLTGSETGDVYFEVRRFYQVKYDANGGTEAPSAQEVMDFDSFDIASKSPIRDGYTFLGWATSSTATSATYQPGDSFKPNDDITLYAVWGKGCGNNHSYRYTVTKEPSLNVSGELVGTCTKCAETSMVVLPRINDTDYTPGQRWEATCTQGAVCQYTWNTTTYGNYCFDVVISGMRVHDGKYQVTKEPTVDETGTFTEICSVCSKVMNVVILPMLNKTDYSWGVLKFATCTETGVDCYVWNEMPCILHITTPAKGHSFGQVTVHAPAPGVQGYSEHTCSSCGFTEKFDYVDFRGVSVSGTVTSYLTDGTVTIRLMQSGKAVYSTTASGKNAAYTFDVVEPGTYTLEIRKADHITRSFRIEVTDTNVVQDAKICPEGDVTGDGVVNIKDFQRLLRHVNKTNSLSGYTLSCGDVTGDGTCNIKDFQRLLRHVNKTNPLF